MNAPTFAETVAQDVTIPRFSRDSLRVRFLKNLRIADPRSRFYG
jgi:hypothetical protein